MWAFYQFIRQSVADNKPWDRFAREILTANGSTLQNGAATKGTIALGDLDVWSFSASAGDGIMLRMGAATFTPWIRLYGPNGAVVQDFLQE